MPSIPVLHLEGFDGAMDLLLDLAERQRIDLGRISIVALAVQFVAAMYCLAPHVPVERRADWLVLATRPVPLRSRLLFPATPEAAAAAERDVVRELARFGERALMRRPADWLQARPQLGRDVFARPRGRDPRVVPYMALMEACLTMLCRTEANRKASVYRPIVREFWRVSQALGRIRALSTKHPEGGDPPAFVPKLPETPERVLKVKAAIASTLVAGLELAKDGEVVLDQLCECGAIGLSRVAAGATGTSARAGAAAPAERVAPAVAGAPAPAEACG